MLIAPSILSANFAKLGDEIDSINKTNCNYLHIDIMDGHFVPNLTFGPPVVESIKKHSKKPLDIHLMVRNIPFFVELFMKMKPEFISIHIEEEKHLNRVINLIKSNGIKAGVALNPHTSHLNLEYIIKDIDLVLIMSVNPGFGGQNFIENTLEKIKIIKKIRDAKNPNCLIEIDGGVNDSNAKLIKQAGADIAVCGNYIFSSKNYQEAIDKLK